MQELTCYITSQYVQLGKLESTVGGHDLAHATNKLVHGWLIYGGLRSVE